MKTLIYTAVGLFACASVFGLADFFSAKKDGTLVNYSEERIIPEAGEVKTEMKTVKLKTTAETKKPVVAKKQVASMQKRKLKKSIEVVEAVTEQPSVVSAPVMEDAVPALDKTKVEEVIVPEAKVEKRRINMEMFSRAAPNKGLKKKSKE